MKQEVLDKIELIKNSGNLSLEDYCQAVSKYLPHQHDMNKMNFSIAHADNENQARLGQLLLSLASKGVLPELKGFLGSNSINAADSYGHDGYIGTHDYDGDFELFISKGLRGTGDTIVVPLESINVVSAFEESEVIATSTEAFGHYYIVFHDDCDFDVLAISDDNFIKALCSLSLMTDSDVYFGVIEELPRGCDFDLSDPLETLSRAVFGATDSMVDGFEKRPDYDELYDRYWELREG
jgi:hypothetical protein